MNGVTWHSTMDGKDPGDAMNRAIELALRQAGIIVEEQAVALAPTDTGRLKGSITWRTKQGGSQVRGPATGDDAVGTPDDTISVNIGTNVDYAQHQEYGTRFMDAQPFLRPALHAKKKVILRDFAKWVQEYLKRGR